MPSGGALRIVVMGVAGSGKTTVGTQLAAQLGARFVDGDDLHPGANVAKMSAGVPLTDADRWPWLARVRDELRDGAPVVVACSALARRYRDALRVAGGVRFAFLDLDPDAASERAAKRSDHFMGAHMVASQFATLEHPAADETDVVAVDATASPAAVVAAIVRWLGSTDASRAGP